MKKYLLFVLASLFGVFLIIKPALAACDPNKAGTACSVQNYKEKMCKPWNGVVKVSFEKAAMGSVSPPVGKLAEYFIAQWEKNLERKGKVPILSDPEKAHVYHITRGIYAGKWKSPEDVYKNCLNEGDAFPQFLREELVSMKKHFSSRTMAQSR